MPKGDQARVEILEAAKRLFLSKGYGSSSMRDIAKEAGDRAVAGIYNHFSGKEAVFQALIEEHNPAHHAIDALISVEGDTATEFLRNLMNTMLPLLLKNYEFLELAQIDLREFGGKNTRRILQLNVVPQAVQMAAKLQSLPGMKPVDPLVLLRLLVSVFLGYAITRHLAPDMMMQRLSDSEWIDAYVSMILSGLCETTGKDASQ